MEDIPPSALSIALGAMGAVRGIIEATRQKNNINGYFVNKNEREICLIPLILNDKTKYVMKTANTISNNYSYCYNREWNYNKTYIFK